MVNTHWKSEYKSHHNVNTLPCELSAGRSHKGIKAPQLIIQASILKENHSIYDYMFSIFGDLWDVQK